MLKSLEKALLDCTRVIWPLAAVETGVTLSSGCLILRQDDEGISSLLFLCYCSMLPCNRATCLSRVWEPGVVS